MISAKCDFCDKTIEAYTQKHLNQLLLQHVIAKHPEKAQEALALKEG